MFLCACIHARRSGQPAIAVLSFQRVGPMADTFTRWIISYPSNFISTQHHCSSLFSSVVSAFLMLWPFNTGPHAAVTPNFFFLLLHNHSFVTVRNRNVNMIFPMILGNPCNRVSFDLQVEKCWFSSYREGANNILSHSKTWPCFYSSPHNLTSYTAGDCVWSLVHDSKNAGTELCLIPALSFQFYMILRKQTNNNYIM